MGGYLQAKLGFWQEVAVEIGQCGETEITGTVTNESTVPLTVGVQVWFWGEDGLIRIDGGASPPLGPGEGGFDIGRLEPGETREWSVPVPDAYSGYDTCEAHVGYARLN